MINFFKMSIGKRIKQKRDSLGLSQEGLGDMAGITNVTLSRIESGKVNPTKETVTKLAAALGVSQAYLLGETDDPTPIRRIVEQTCITRQGIRAQTVEERLEAIERLLLTLPERIAEELRKK